ncbi:MAG: hypothetical protein ACT4QD_09820 [Acidobacteriota bacterium]
MARVRLIHWNEAEGREAALRLASLGHHADFEALDGPRLLRAVRASPPEAIVIDLSRRPSHGREVGLALRSYKTTRRIPLVFVGGEKEKVARIRALLPDAAYTTWGRVHAALVRALARRVRDPVVPPSSIYSSKPAVEKLGIKPGMRVAVLGAPPRIEEAILMPRPRGVTLSARPEPTCDLFLAFVRSQRELAVRLLSLTEQVGRQTVWFIWPKATSKVPSDLTANLVRETGLASGWVDFKVCSVDATWSGLAFKRRR